MNDMNGYQPALRAITELSPHDVLMGRGAPNAYYVGNVSFRQLVAQYKPAYLSTARHQLKQDIALQVYQEIGKRNGRFLTEFKVEGQAKASKSWVIADKEVALEKVKQALRERDVCEVVYVPTLPSSLDSLTEGVQASASSHGLNGREQKEPPRPPEAVPPQRLEPVAATVAAASASTMQMATSAPSYSDLNPTIDGLLQLVPQGNMAQRPASLLPLGGPHEGHHPFHSTSTLELLMRQRNEQMTRDNEQRAALLWWQEQENRRRQDEQALAVALLTSSGPNLAQSLPLAYGSQPPLGLPLPLVTSTLTPGGLARASLPPIHQDQGRDALWRYIRQGEVLQGGNSNYSEHPISRALTAHANAPNIATALESMAGHAATGNSNKRSTDASDGQGPLDCNGPTAQRPRGN